MTMETGSGALDRATRRLKTAIMRLETALAEQQARNQALSRQLADLQQADAEKDAQKESEKDETIAQLHDEIDRLHQQREQMSRKLDETIATVERLMRSAA